MSTSSSGKLQWLGFASPCRKQQLQALALVPNGRYDLGSLNSVVAVFSGRVAIVLKFYNLQF